MADRDGLFAGDDPFDIARGWLAEAERSEPNDPNAIALATVDADGMPDARMVLLKDIEGQGTDGSFVFYTNYDSAKGRQITATGKAAFVMHWKSLRRQIRVRGHVTRVEGAQADAYYDSRALQSRLGAWASRQSQPLESRAALAAEVAKLGLRYGTRPPRPPFWGGFRVAPVQMEFWADGAFRLHDRFRWNKEASGGWFVERLSP
ncbi:pyridoxamine 5'-phosphate oxidase [Paracoccus sediminis]|uniref:Pyridoxine/pyridoxamine 5'-phosphate oxidase n=1 Tax=Paracoccus sediminis TaxID=1214787 RepID=A0A238WIT7_9RHOB|nr:pyridoxamine 5'-phosphate oxidase [Paracoccus sediminis]TBN50851.1 pyridoxamine 5'-phosphate oxidase [Paracoccus sediminis]SNR45589.1 Pyridoxamine 5'-phosphate oxidase [Paracoccus sediminis]